MFGPAVNTFDGSQSYFASGASSLTSVVFCPSTVELSVGYGSFRDIGPNREIVLYGDVKAIANWAFSTSTQRFLSALVFDNTTTVPVLKSSPHSGGGAFA